MNLLFLYGPPAVGKLTIGQRVADSTGWHLFHNHLTVDLLTSVFDFGSELFVELREQIWLGVFRHAATTNQNLVFTFTPERTVRPEFIRAAISTVEAAGGAVRFVELTVLERSWAAESSRRRGEGTGNWPARNACVNWRRAERSTSRCQRSPG